MSDLPTLIFVPGSWHKPKCYEKVIRYIEDESGIKCVPVTLPSTQGDPNATFKDDIDVVRNAITSEFSRSQNVIVIAHSYGGMVGNSAIKGLTRPKNSTGTNASYVVGLILIASGFTITGLAFMDPFFGIPPPSWRFNRETGYAELVANPREFFYHDLDDVEANYWVDHLTTHSSKSLLEGGEYAYAGWQDVPTWYVGTLEDKGLPVIVQRVQVAVARGQGAIVHHTELKSSHSPFLSLPTEVAAIILEAVQTVCGKTVQVRNHSQSVEKAIDRPAVKLGTLATWFRYGIPFFIGRTISWGLSAFLGIRRLWVRR